LKPATFTRRPEIRGLRPADNSREEEVLLGAGEISILVTIVSCVAIAYAFPFRSVKYALFAFFGFLLVWQTLKRPALGLALIAFGIPAIDLVPPGLIPIRGVNAETVLIMFLIFIKMRADAVDGRDVIRSRMTTALLIYAGLIVVSCFNGWLIWRSSLFDLLAAAKNHLSYMVFLPVAFHVARSPRDRLLLVGAISISIFLNCLQAIDHSWMAFATGKLDRYRASALLAIQPNIFGAALAIYLPLMLLMALDKLPSKLARGWFALCAAACLFALFLTLSRGSWLGAVAALIVIAAVKERRLLIVMVLLAATHQFWVPQQALDRIELTGDAEVSREMGPDQIADDSTQVRIEQYKSLPAMMQPRPILGWGYQSYPRVFERYGTMGRKKGAHTSYALIGTEEGLVGLAVLFMVLASMFFIGMQAYKNVDQPLARTLGLVVATGAVAAAVCMVSGSRFEAQKIYAHYWILFGIAERSLALHRMRLSGGDKMKVGGDTPRGV
jgi:O-antigen ligase